MRRRIAVFTEAVSNIEVSEETFTEKFGNKAIHNIERQIERGLENGSYGLDELAAKLGTTEGYDKFAEHGVSVTIEAHCEKHDVWTPQSPKKHRQCWRCAGEARDGKSKVD